MTKRTLIYDLTFDDFLHTLNAWGEPSYRAYQLWQGLYRQFWSEPEQFTSLPITLRQKIGDHFSFNHLEPTITLNSSDGETTKTLFHLTDSHAIETVYMQYEKRRTLCISTQAGCAMDCVFCATGQMGFRRNLTSGEIVEQVLYYARQLQTIDERVTNVVFMGMGEPFHNYNETISAIKRLNHHDGFALGARRFTISTVGLVPGIRRFTAENHQVNLAVSLHAVDDELRSSMIPINKKYPLNELLNACREYVDHTKRRITFEWALIQDINDSPQQAKQLAQILNGLLCHVNIIPLNATQNYNGIATTHELAQSFKNELERLGIPCTIRLRRGIDIQAGCGQLAINNK